MILTKLTDYLNHLLQSKSIYSVHSPFVFEWHREVLRADASEKGTEIESLRKKLSKDQRMISPHDFGAGSANKGSKKGPQRLGKLVAKASRKRASGELLYRLCLHHQPSRCLEFGTHVGISSLYQLTALSNSQFITMEGDPGLAAIATENFQKFGLSPTQLVGEFSQLLAEEVKPADYRPDYVFIDGNHKYAPTMEYFHELLPYLPDESLIVFDDIYWSDEMKKAWAEIILHPEVSLSIDLFFLGICYVRRKQAKEHFRFKL